MNKFVKKTHDEIFKEIDKELRDGYGDFSEPSDFSLWRDLVTDRIYSLWNELEKINNTKEGE